MAEAETSGDGPPDAERAAETRLYAFLATHGIAWQHTTHPPLFTVEDSRALRGTIPGAHVKNMFLKEKKGGLWLVTCRETRQIRIRDLEREIGAKGCSFAKPELLWEVLGVRPGAVTPFAALNDTERRVGIVLDRQILGEAAIAAHPLHNRATTTIALADLRRFFALTGHAPLEVDFDALEARAAAQAAERP
ncbi:MAG: prolyl-tRNA synthetase associated domain-containing protein [Paracoccaceae bacterium]